ncbi:MAG: hypothetical protein IPM54_35585 [Polyangiaceae bacterium]|nr:hypothetical protein [Polyangiaceae bacterium]
MDPKHNGYNGGRAMLAPGTVSSVSTYVLPSRERTPTPAPGPFPRVDDHLVEPEVTRDIVIRGERMVAQPAEKDHADAHARVDFVLLAHVKDDRTSSSDLLTRVTQGSDFATDGSVRRSGNDPATGARYLEELSFEVVNEQSPGRAKQKAEDLAYRGIRRIFGIFVKTGTVGEWSREKNEFVPLDAGSFIEDEALIRPIAVRALLDRAQAEIDVAKALIKKNNPEIVKLKRAAEDRGHKKGLDEGHKKGLDEGYKQGDLQGRRAMLREIMEEQFGALTPSVTTRIESASIEQIRAWTKKLRHATSCEDVFAENDSPS